MASAHIGSKVRIKVIEGDEFSGFVHSVDANTGKLTLDKVTLCGRGGVDRRIQGLQHFYGKEIENIIKCEEVCPKLKKNASTGNLTKYKEAGPSLKKTKNKPKHLQKLRRLDTEKLLLSSRPESAEEATNVKSRICARAKSSDYDSSSDVGDFNNYDPDSRYHLVNKLDHRFYDAMEYLHQQSMIAVAFEGVEIGREGKLAWISIATKDDLLLLDVLSLGEKCFSEGFKDILESQKILKVIHDCRLLSDLLHHQYLIKLINIFDTQVADVMIYHIRHKDWPRYVSGLSSCLFSHLELSSEQVHIMRVRESAKKEDQEIWCKRPAPGFVMEAAVKHVEHLLDLRLILMEKMMAEFTVGVDIYLAQVKDVSDAEAKKALSSSHLLPFAFQHLSQFLHASHFNYTMPLRMRNPLSSKDRHGFEENCQGIMDPDVIASVDSIWHQRLNKNCPGSQQKISNSLDQSSSKERQNQRSTSAVSKSDQFPETCSIGESSTIPISKDLTVHDESSASFEAQNKSNNSVFSCATPSCSEDIKSSSKIPEFVVPRVDSPSEFQHKIRVLTTSKSMSSLKLDEKPQPSESELTGSQLLKTLMAEIRTSGSSSETDFVLRPAGKLQYNLPKRQRRSLNTESRCKKSQAFVCLSKNESSTCDEDDYFGDIPLTEHLRRSGKLVNSKLCESVPQAVINSGSGRMVIPLSSSESDSDVANPRRFDSLEKQSKELRPIVPKTNCELPFCSIPNRDEERSSQGFSEASISSVQQTSPPSLNCSQIQESLPIPWWESIPKTQTSSVSDTFVDKVHTHSVTSHSILADSPYSRPSPKSSEPSPALTYFSIGRGYRSPNSSSYCQVSSASSQQTTPSPVGRARSPAAAAADTAYVSACSHFGRGGSPSVHPSGITSPGSSGSSQDESSVVKISPSCGHGAVLPSSYANRTSHSKSPITSMSQQISPRSLGRGIHLQ
ncbi:uncharacterized protein LOC121374519 [Gigantopelta aegis]|uniref:uncharacterized protein LOC121374519 n=1 Tax=Gigantopelta aegis TaxID=1735272 RepID=UPI001B88779A|nr:uncharacterized protein LOC121374519 [Gigantopelta aegis]